MSFRIETATARDIPLILSLIREMATFEKMLDAVRIDEECLMEFVFGARPCAEVLIGYWGGEAVSYAIVLPKFASFRGRPNLYLEDLFVRESMRGKGLGKALLKHVARMAVERDCAYVEWNALNWNEPAMGFYRELGAEAIADRTYFSLRREALAKLAVE